MPEENTSNKLQGTPDSQPPMQPPPETPGNDTPPPTPAKSNSIDNQAAAQELEEIKVGERWLIGVGIAGVLVNMFLGWVYYSQLTQMREATQASKQAVQLARDALDYNSSQFDRQMGQMIDQSVAARVGSNAARNAADTSSRALNVSERAYIETSGVSFNEQEKTLLIPVVNTGHIPSGGVVITVHESTLNTAARVGENVPVIEAHWTEDKVPSVVPSEPAGIVVRIPKLDVALVKADKQQFFAIGSIIYTDGFPNTPRRIWKFCIGSGVRPPQTDILLFPCDPEEELPKAIKSDEYPNPKYHTKQ